MNTRTVLEYSVWLVGKFKAGNWMGGVCWLANDNWQPVTEIVHMQHGNTWLDTAIYQPIQWTASLQIRNTETSGHTYTQTHRQTDTQTERQTQTILGDGAITNTSAVQQLQCVAEVCGGASSERRIWSGNSLYSSASVSNASACLATAWNACSTFSASLALVSKYGKLPLLVHHCCARFGITFNDHNAVWSESSKLSTTPVFPFNYL